MDPITLTILLGFKLTEEAMVKLGYTENTMLQPMKWTDFNKNHESLRYLKLSEGLENPAKFLKGEKRTTIGFGSTFIYNSNGTNYNGNAMAPAGITLSQLKNNMGYSNLTDIEFADQLVVNHIKFDSKVKNVFLVFKDLDSAGVPLNKILQGALVDSNYMSGSIWVNKSVRDSFVMACKFALTDDQLAKTYCQVRYNYVRNNAPNWSVNRWGWIKRIFEWSMYIKTGVYKKYDSPSSTNSAREKWFKNLYAVNFGILISV